MSSRTSPSPSVDFTPVDFYNFANCLYQDHSSEVAYRTVIGRAYYAAFLCARDSANIVNTSGSVHKEVITHFTTRKKKIGGNLKDLRDLREKADYHANKTVQKREAGESLRLAKNILIELNYLPKQKI